MPDITPHIIKAIPKSDRLGNLIDLIDSGTAVDPGETSEQGTPVYQVNNIAPFELLKTKVYTQRTDIKLLDKGDIVTGRVGSIGSFALFDSETLSSFSDNVLRIRIKHDFQSRLRFLLAFLNSSLTAKQIAKARKGSLQGVINQATLKTIVIPLLPSNLESNLTSSMQAEREACKRKLEQADALLASLDPFFLDQLGLPAPIIGTRAGYAIHRSRAKSANRLNADYFHPERIRALQTIHKSKNVRRAERLADIADFIRNIERVSVPSEYIGLANVQSNTGELV